MRTDEYISALRKEHNIIINVDHNDDIKIRGSQQSLTSEIIKEIRERKLEIVTFFKGLSDHSATKPIPRAGIKDGYKLSSIQSRLYFLYQLDKHSLAYNMPRVDKLEGTLDIARLKETFRRLYARHEVFRTYFAEQDGLILQRIARGSSFDIEYHHISAEELPAAIQGFIRPFDLNKGGLVRVGLLEVTPSEHYLLIDMHHIIADGVSHGILSREFIALYNNDELPALQLQYKDYTEWQQGAEQQRKMELKKQFWMDQFAELPAVLHLPTDFQRPALIDYKGDTYSFEIGKEAAYRLKAIAEEQEATLFMVLLAIFNILLSRLADQDDIVVGTPIAGRQHADVDNMIGMFANTLPLRNYPRGSLSFRQFLAGLRANVLACFDNQSFQFEDLIHELKIPRDTSRNPLFDVMLLLENYEEPVIRIPGLTIRSYENALNTAKFDMTWKIKEREGKLLITIEYLRSLFAAETISKFASCWRQITSTILLNPDCRIADIEWVQEKEKAALLHDHNATRIDYPDETIVSLFERQSARTPENIALRWADRTLTYRQLDTLSGMLAIWLEKAGVRTGDLVGLVCNRDEYLVLSILGILKAGAAYVPVDPSYPAARIRSILEDARVRIVVTTENSRLAIGPFEGRIAFADNILDQPEGGLDGLPGQENARPKAGPSDPAYVIYTSGSSGKPKGVVIEHRSLYNIIRNLQDLYPLGPDHCYLLKTTYCFDVSCAEIFGWFPGGGSLAILADGSQSDPRSIIAAIRQFNISHINFVPSLFAHFVEELEKEGTTRIQSLQYIFLAGEALPLSLVKRFKALESGIALWNLYGPTEGTIYSCGYPVQLLQEGRQSVPIGKPFGNIQLYVLDRYQHLVPDGIPGELYIGGTGVAREYLHNEVLTGLQFPDLPGLNGKRVYRTGDRVKRLPDGNLEYLGRMDDQVKVRGYRIETGEIAGRLSGHDGISAAAVVVKEREGDKFLVAYYAAPAEIDVAALREYLQEQLPDYMVPAFFVRLDKLPISSNGKLDKRKLPEPTIVMEGSWIAPQTKEEILLAAIWSRVLGLEKIGAMDNFFFVGGDSIKSIQICSRLRSAGYELSVKEIFTYQTIRQLAPRLKTTTNTAPQTPVTGHSALTPVQKWFFDGPVVRKEHFNQSVLLNFPGGLDKDTVENIFSAITSHHDALRMVFSVGGEGVIQENKGLEMPLALTESDLSNEADPATALLAAANRIQAGIDLARGPLMRLGLFHMPVGSRLLIVIHHLVVDGISWRILLEDLDTLYQQRKNGSPYNLPLKTEPFLSWRGLLDSYAGSPKFDHEKKYWASAGLLDFPVLPRDFKPGKNNGRLFHKVSFRLDQGQTLQLLTKVHIPYNTQINDILLAALMLSIHQQFGLSSIGIDLESHGRETWFPGRDLSRTVGWFTSIYPVLLEKSGETPDATIRQIKETLRQVPGYGTGYLLQGTNAHNSSICFNYLGQFDTDLKSQVFALAKEDGGREHDPDEPGRYDWEISGMIIGGQLEIRFQYSIEQYREDTMDSMLRLYKERLQELIGFCISREQKLLSPSDLTLKDIPISLLDRLQEKYPIENIYPLSPLQEGILFHTVLEGDSNSYCMQTTFRILGDLDVKAVEESMNRLMARYDILRTLFLHEGLDRRLQVVLKKRAIDFRFEDIRETCHQQDKQEVIRSRHEQERAKPFDPASDVLMRLVVLRIGETEYELIWNHHHMLMDGWCVSILVDEFMTVYSSLVKGTHVELAPVKPYSTYIEWLGNLEKDKAGDWWKQYLAGFDSPVGLPKREHEGPDARTAEQSKVQYELKSHRLVIAKEDMGKLRGISRKYGVTLNTIIQGVWGLLLARYNNVRDVVFGSVVSGRPAAIEGVESMVGLFVNTIPVRVRYQGDESVGEFLKKLQVLAMDSEEHHYHPLSEIQSLSEPGNALLDHIIAFENFPIAEQIREAGHGSGNAGHPFEVGEVGFFLQTNYDLSITILPMEEGVVIFDFNLNKYDTALIRQAAGHFANLVHSVADDPEKRVKDVSIYGTEEIRDLQQWLTTDLETGQDVEPIQHKLDRSFKKFGNHCAIEYNGNQFTYDQVGLHVSKVSDALAAQGVLPRSFVGILCSDRQWLISSILGVLRSGSAFVPLETSLPAGRLSSMISQASLRFIITDMPPDFYGKLGLGGDVTWIEISSGGEVGSKISIGMDRSIGPVDSKVAWGENDLDASAGAEGLERLKGAGGGDRYDLNAPAYIYYTSGSTGNPKGVVGKNKGLSHFIGWEIAAFRIDHTFRFSQFTNPGFDVFMRDIFVPLCSGGTICIPDEEILSTAPRIREWIDGQRISLIHCVPSFFKLFGKSDLREGLYPSLKYILLAGEKVSPVDLLQWNGSVGERVRLVNIYGPTETTLAKGFHVIGPDDLVRGSIPVKAIAGAQFLVLDKDMQLCPPFALGEIYIRTPYRSAGYLDRNATASSFIPNPFNPDASEDLLYKTGDLGRAILRAQDQMDPDQTDLDQMQIEIAGRSDHQIKIRGIRIEPDDIRQNILQFPGVADAVVLIREDKEGEKFLCAYIVPENAGHPVQAEHTGDEVAAFALKAGDTIALRLFLEERMPRFMIPSYLIPLSKFPLLPNGKLDRKALPEPGIEPAANRSSPMDETENKLADIWAEVLNADKINIDINKSFFEMGGHSIKIFHLINRVQQSFDIKLKLGDIFQHSSIRKTAALLRSLRTVSVDSIPLLGEQTLYVASPAQKRIYYQYLLDKTSLRYNISMAVRVSPDVDISRINNAFAALIARHPGLRTSFILTEDNVYMKVHENIPFHLEQSHALDDVSPAEVFNAFIQPFDLAADSLFRCGLHIGKEETVLMVDVHHIVADGLSLDIMIRDFSKLFAGDVLAALPLRYVDYAAWVNETHGALQQQWAYWKEQLAGGLPASVLPAIRSRASGNKYLAAEKTFILSGKLYEDAKQFAADNDASDFVFLLSVFYILLSRLSGQTDLVIGTDVVGRTRAALQDIVGTFVNILPLRVNVEPAKSYRDFLRDVRQTVVNGFDNQDIQFDQMVSYIRDAGRQGNETPLVDVHFSFSNTIDDRIGLAGFELFDLNDRQTSMTHYELQVEVREQGNQLEVSFLYSRELYDADMIGLMVTYFGQIIAGILRDPSAATGAIGLEN